MTAQDRDCTQPPKVLLFFINLELQDGKNERLNFHSGDSPEEVAFDFCRKKGLNLKIFNFIVASLNDKIADLKPKAERPKSTDNPQNPPAGIGRDLDCSDLNHTKPVGLESTQNESYTRLSEATPLKPALDPRLKTDSLLTPHASQKKDPLLNKDFPQQKPVPETEKKKLSATTSNPMSSGASKLADYSQESYFLVTPNNKENLQPEEDPSREEPKPHRNLRLSPQHKSSTDYHSRNLFDTLNDSSKQQTFDLDQQAELRPNPRSLHRSKTPKNTGLDSSFARSKPSPSFQRESANSQLFYYPRDLPAEPSPQLSRKHFKSLSRSSVLATQQTQQSSQYPGHRLYNLAVSNHLRKQAQIEQSQLLREELEVADVSFTPEVNVISSLIHECKFIEQPYYERLNRFGEEKRAKQEMIRQLRSEVENSRFDFKPKIDPISQIISKQRDKSLEDKDFDRFQQLYEIALKKNKPANSPLREKQLNATFTFKPAINEHSRKLARDTGDFAKRLQTSIEQKELRHKLSAEKHLKAGQPAARSASHQKRARDASANQQSKARLQVYSQLYEAGKTQASRMKELVQKEVDRIKKDMDRAKASSSSNHIFNELVGRRVFAMFEHLDQDKTGAVQAADPSAFGSMPAEVRKLFEPFLKLLGAKEQPVTFETFEYLFKKFVRVASADQNLNVEERRAVLSLGEEKKKKLATKNPHLTFKVRATDAASHHRTDPKEENRPQPQSLLQQRSTPRSPAAGRDRRAKRSPGAARVHFPADSQPVPLPQLPLRLQLQPPHLHLARKEAVPRRHHSSRRRERPERPGLVTVQVTTTLIKRVARYPLQFWLLYESLVHDGDDLAVWLNRRPSSRCSGVILCRQRTFTLSFLCRASALVAVGAPVFSLLIISALLMHGMTATPSTSPSELTRWAGSSSWKTTYPLQRLSPVK